MSVVRRLGRVRLLALSLGHVFWSTPSAADLTLREVVALTIERSPQLGAFVSESQAARQQAIAAAVSPPLELEAEFENFGGTGDVSSARALETTLQLSKVFELGGKARKRDAVGREELSRIEARQRATRADVIAEAARRFLHVLSDQAQLEVTRRATQLAERARDVVQARVREGAISTVFLNRAAIELARARIEQEHAEHELATSRVALATLWGEPNPSFTRASGELFAFPSLESLESYMGRLEQNPDLLTFASQERVVAARKRLAESQRAPNVTFNAGVRRLEGFDDQAFVAGFSVPLGTRSRAEPQIQAARAEGEQLRLNAAARRLELQATLFGLYQEIVHARAAASVMHEEIGPQARRMVETTADGYGQGRYSLVELIDAQRALADVERDSIRAALDFHTNLIEMERATGVGVHALADR